MKDYRRLSFQINFLFIDNDSSLFEVNTTTGNVTAVKSLVSF